MSSEKNVVKIINAIQESIDKFNSTFDSYTGIMRSHIFSGPEEEHDFSNEYEEKLLFLSTDIYYLFIFLFDISQNSGMRAEFIKTVGERYKNNKDIFESRYYELPDDYFSVLSGDYYDFIKPYKVLYETGIENDSKVRSVNIKTLERLLEETNLLCRLSATKPDSEPKVYNTVKQYIYILFPRSNNVSGQSFPNIAKVYKPDIFIPECNAAVEYKYIDKEEKISSTVAGIADDVKGYKEDSDYDIFYAVFYFKSAFLTQERFLEIWNEKKFPKNWKPIYVVETN